MKLNKQSMTLTQLVVAVVLMGIVMLGVLNFSLVIKNLQGSTNKATLLKMKTMAAMSHLVQDAESAIGDSVNEGIQTFDSGAADPTRSICFRHGDNPGNPNDATPDNYDDDPWVCYIHESDYIIYRCQLTWANYKNNRHSLSESIDDISDCGGSEEKIIEIIQNSSNEYKFFEPDAYQMYILRLHTVFNPDQPTDNTIENPEFETQTLVHPVGHSW